MNNITQLKGISTPTYNFLLTFKKIQLFFYFFTNKGFTKTESLCYNLIVMVP
jgi:hypothetical protein